MGQDNDGKRMSWKI